MRSKECLRAIEDEINSSWGKLAIEPKEITAIKEYLKYNADPSQILSTLILPVLEKKLAEHGIDKFIEGSRYQHTDPIKAKKYLDSKSGAFYMKYAKEITATKREELAHEEHQREQQRRINKPVSGDPFGPVKSSPPSAAEVVTPPPGAAPAAAPLTWADIINPKRSGPSAPPAPEYKEPHPGVDMKAAPLHHGHIGFFEKSETHVAKDPKPLENKSDSPRPGNKNK